MSRVLLCTSDLVLSDRICSYFKKHGLSCKSTFCFMEICAITQSEECDLVILDTDEYGPRLETVCRLVRKKRMIPILFLVDRNSSTDILFLHGMDFDDYIWVPLAMDVLITKSKMVIERANKGKYAEIVRCGAVELHTAGRLCFVGSEKKRLTRGQYDLLLYLMLHQNEIISRHTLLRQVWGKELAQDLRIVDIRIRMLRSILACSGNQIKSVYGIGYKLIADHA